MSEIDLKLAERCSRELALSLYHFDKEILGYSKMEKEPHLPLCEFVNDRYTESEGGVLKPFKLILMPRNSFKTSIVTIGFPIQSLVLNPNIRILIANERFDNAKTFLLELKGHLEKNELFRGIYGDLVGKKTWTSEEITISTRTKNLKEPSVSTAGIGVVKVGMHYDLIIMDDLVSQENTTTKEQMDKVINFYRLALSLLDPNGRIIVIGTRWHFNDLYNFLLENEKHRFDYFIRSSYREDGTLLFPQVLSKEFLENQRKSQSGYIFACQYLNNPIDDETATFKKEQIHHYRIAGKTLIPIEEEVTDETGKVKRKPYFSLDNLNIYLTVDPAISQRKSGDFTGMVVAGIDPEDRVFVLHAKKYKIQPKEIIDTIFELWKKYNVMKVGIETNVFQIMLSHFLLDEMKRRRQYLPIVKLTTSNKKTKEMRISGLQPRFQFGTIYLSNDMAELEDELLRFPVGQHDDILDALAQQLELWSKPSFSKNTDAPVGSFDWIRNKIINRSKYDDYIGNENIDRWRELNENWY